MRSPGAAVQVVEPGAWPTTAPGLEDELAQRGGQDSQLRNAEVTGELSEGADAQQLAGSATGKQPAGDAG